MKHIKENKEQQTIIIGLLITTLIFANYAINSDIFMYLFLAISISVVLFAKTNHSIIYILIFSPYSEVIRVAASGIYFYFFYFLAFIINFYFIKKNGINLKSLLVFLTFILYVIVTNNYNDSSRIISILIILLSYFMLIPFSQSYDHLGYDKYIIAFSTSFIISALLGACRLLMPKLDQILRSDEIWINMSKIDRFAGVSWDTNIFALICAFCISLILNSSCSKLYKIFAISILAVFGILTYSKMFIISLVIIACLYSIMELKVNIFKISVLFTGLLIFYLSLNWLFDNQLFETIVYRFLSDGIEGLTTGRSTLQKGYLATIFNNVKIFLIGSSLGNENLNGIAAHNTFIQVFYTLGSIGAFVFIAYLLNVIQKIYDNNKWFKINVNLIPIIIFMFSLNALSIFTNTICYLLLFLSLISLFHNKGAVQAERSN